MSAPDQPAATSDSMPAGQAASGAQATPADADDISLLDLAQVVVENLRLLVLAPLVCGLLAFGAASLIAPTFTASTRIMPPQQQASGAAGLIQSLGALGGLAGSVGGIKNPIDQYVAFLKSRSLQDALIDRFALQERYDTALREDARRVLSGRVRISGGKDGLITIEADDTNPQFAADVANAHVLELGQLLKRLAVTEAQERRVFFQAQLEAAKANLVRAELALKATGVGVETLKSDPKAAVEGVARLRASVTAQEVKLAAMRGYLADTAPEFRQAQNELTALRAQLEKNRLETLPSSAASAADGETSYIERYREFKYQETLFELFAKQYEVARIDEAREGATIQVVDPAVAPERKASPKRSLVAAVATLGVFFVLLLWVFVRQSLRNASQDPQAAAKLERLHSAWRGLLGRR
ncbi:Wzz/FepE/Etk N-terminal domain-containing protein [Rhodoferax sp.]|jgi:uncharacterized protein involved in exopolysaccharide biosynthesis|uniref:Wzz/FepE/Etk N-terminal domain-containing protein n=1 Tax=Rhodoferax sp. TaxID=50421 RepID=UPI003784B01A